MASDESIQPAVFELPFPQEVPVDIEIKAREDPCRNLCSYAMHCGSAGLDGW